MAPTVHHVEFFDREHFAFQFHRVKARPPLDTYIDFFWETDFSRLWSRYPEGFTDVLFPNVGYTFLVNLANPFSIQLDKDRPYTVRSDAFLPRFRNISTHHVKGNQVFGIKFRLSPVLLEKKVDFSEYNAALSSLAYLIHPPTLAAVKAAGSFSERVNLLCAYYQEQIERLPARHAIAITQEILGRYGSTFHWDMPVKQLAENYSIDVRTLQRYFTSTTGISTKQALQILRIRKAVTALIAARGDFDCRNFGYYDYSHFFKQMNRLFRSHPAFIKTDCVAHLHRSETKVGY